MSIHKCPNCGIVLKAFEPVFFGNVALLDRGKLVFNGQRLLLPRCQHQIVEALIMAEGRALTASHLAGCLGGDIYDQSIAVYIGRVRSTFRDIDPDFDQIECVRGFGAYKWAYRNAEFPMDKSMVN